MPTREEIIKKLSERYDPRSASEINTAILDTLQEEEPCNVTNLRKAIDKKYDSTEEVFTYQQVRDALLILHSQGIVKNDALTKRFSVMPEYRTHEIRYLPVSNYCVALWTISGVALTIASYYDYMMKQALLITMVGSLYVLGQLLGSEFELNGTYQKLKSILHIQKRQ